jgi:hypothetical protein
MANAKVASIKTIRIFVGIIILTYSFWLISSLFLPQLRELINNLRPEYKVIDFIFIDVFSIVWLPFAGLFMGSLYLLGCINILILKDRPRNAAMNLLATMWVCVILLVLMQAKDGFEKGFSDPNFQSAMKESFAFIRLAFPSIIFLPFLLGEDLDNK